MRVKSTDDHAITHNPKPAGDPGPTQLWVWEAAFPQSAPPVSKKNLGRSGRAKSRTD